MIVWKACLACSLKCWGAIYGFPFFSCLYISLSRIVLIFLVFFVLRSLMLYWVTCTLIISFAVTKEGLLNHFQSQEVAALAEGKLFYPLFSELLLSHFVLYVAFSLLSYAHFSKWLLRDIEEGITVRIFNGYYTSSLPTEALLTIGSTLAWT